MALYLTACFCLYFPCLSVHHMNIVLFSVILGRYRCLGFQLSGSYIHILEDLGFFIT